MEFVQITKDGIDGVGTVPVTALPHWEGHGWRQVDATEPDADPAPEPVRVVPTVQPKASRRAPVATESTEE